MSQPRLQWEQGGTVIKVELGLRVTLKSIFKCLRWIPMKDAMDYNVNMTASVV